MTAIRIEFHEAAAVVKLSSGVTNALSPDLVRELRDVLNSLRTDSKAHAVVLASASRKFFSIGLDLPGLVDLNEQDFGLFFGAFHDTCLELYAFPKPTVAAVTGHAIAGGCILALCCDYRFMAQGRRLMGLNEIKLGVPVPYVADCALRTLIGDRNARDVMETGEFFGPDALAAMGMVDAILPDQEVLPKAVEKARQLGEAPNAAYRLIKQNRIETVEALVRGKREAKDRAFVECWFSRQAQERLRAATEKF